MTLNVAGSTNGSGCSAMWDVASFRGKTPFTNAVTVLLKRDA